MGPLQIWRHSRQRLLKQCICVGSFRHRNLPEAYVLQRETLTSSGVNNGVALCVLLGCHAQLGILRAHAIDPALPTWRDVQFARRGLAKGTKGCLSRQFELRHVKFACMHYGSAWEIVATQARNTTICHGPEGTSVPWRDD